MKVNRLNESSDGWDVSGSSLKDVLDEIYNLAYEVDNCVRGSYSNCKTYYELANYIRSLADNLNYAADEIEESADDEEDLEEEILNEENYNARLNMNRTKYIKNLQKEIEKLEKVIEKNFNKYNYILDYDPDNMKELQKCLDEYSDANNKIYNLRKRINYIDSKRENDYMDETNESLVKEDWNKDNDLLSETWELRNSISMSKSKLKELARLLTSRYGLLYDVSNFYTKENVDFLVNKINDLLNDLDDLLNSIYDNADAV